MAQYAKPLANLIRELSKLPGIGGKSAQRLAFHILSMDDREAEVLANSITRAKSSMRYCSVCGNLTESDPCEICSDEKRDRTVICVVEQARDVAAMERMKEYNGLYHVLNGAISPMDGIGPEDINLKQLIIRLQQDVPGSDSRHQSDHRRRCYGYVCRASYQTFGNQSDADRTRDPRRRRSGVYG